MRLAVIPAKGTSRRIPGKNLRLFHGHPIMAYSIETALRSGLFDHVAVSTENYEVAEVAKRYGAEIVKRPFELAEIHMPDCGTQEVARHAIKTYIKGGCPITHACCIYPTAPLMLPEDLHWGWAILNGTFPPADFVYSVGPGLQDAGQWYWGTAEAFLERRPLTASPSVVPWYIQTDRVCDINTEEDWRDAEILFRPAYSSLKPQQGET